jgi:hypothetical protein
MFDHSTMSQHVEVYSRFPSDSPLKLCSLMHQFGA